MTDHQFAVRRLHLQDVAQLIHLSDTVGWDYDEGDICTIMSSGTVYGHVTQTGDVVSCAAVIPYGKDLVSIGMVIVHPSYRRLGLGREATIQCITTLDGTTPIMLVATPEGKPMYEALGFKTVDLIRKFLCDAYRSPGINMGECSIVPFRPDYLPDLLRLDRKAVGAAREKLITARIAQANETVLAINTVGNVVGYALSVQGTANLLIGPVVAPKDTVALSLLDRLAAGHIGRLRIDIPAGKATFESLVTACGFDMVASPPVMMLNGEKLPERNGTLFGIAAQAFG